MESKLSWISEQTVFDVESFVRQFDYEAKESTVHDIEELIRNKRIPHITRKAIQRRLELWLAVDHGTFWEDQKKVVAAKKALSDAQTAIIGKASDLVPGTLDQVGKPQQKKVPHDSNTLPEPTATSSTQPTTSMGQPTTSPVPLLQPISLLLQPTSVKHSIHTAPIQSQAPPPSQERDMTEDNNLTLDDLSTVTSSPATSSFSSTAPSISTSVPFPSISLTSAPALDDPADTSAESEQLLEREREELLRSVDESGHPLCDWKIDDTCAACLFADYRRTCIKALTASEIKRTDIADIMAIIGVFAPTMPTIRMHEFFLARQLKVISEPGPELPDVNVDDEKIMKAVRLYLKNKGDEAEVPSVGGNKKIRLMLETLLEYLPLKTDNAVSESTFTVKYVAPIVQAYIDGDGVTSDFPNTDSTTQKQQNLKADRLDIRAKALEREILWGEVTGPIQARNNAKNLWDIFKLARYGKAFIIAGNDSAPLVQVIDNHGAYMKLHLKARGLMLLEEVGTFVIPTRKEMVPALVATLPTLELLKEHVKKLSNGEVNRLKRSWGHQDDKIEKKRLL
ncbi:hypothetical protein EC957_008063 [Mortierella hygrophila]|uniref:Uncharacterized protein n=1 Tax=Mortierella hygrophila TaxID=979708 RepID=A0A9P6EY10_9FUNG|nr:hypothetical protein EC957_008063 [Mortierella hygrophila]